MSNAVNTTTESADVNVGPDMDESKSDEKPSSKRIIRRIIDYVNLPEGVFLVDKPIKNTKGVPLCKVMGCPKQMQFGCEGCCRSHFVKLSIEVEGAESEVDDKKLAKKKKKKPKSAPTLQSIDINNLPDGIELSDSLSKNAKGAPICRVVGCPKQTQGGCEGCCRSHFNKLTINEEVVGRTKKEGSGNTPRIDFDNLPESFEVDKNQPKNEKGVFVCRVVGCTKLSQFNNQGCCRSHFNLLAIEVERTDGESSHEPWNCKCGHVISGRQKVCGACHRWKGGLEERKSKESGINDNGERTGDWTCDCGNVVEAPKSRCGRCHHWRGGKRKCGWKIGVKRVAVDDIGRTTDWECCEVVIPAKQTRCGKCRRWRGGKRMYVGLPPKPTCDNAEKEEG
eukprot:g7599.t1 g7599   contig24:1014946-1016127(+)